MYGFSQIHLLQVGGGLAQLARAPAWHAGGRGFKSRILHWFMKNIRTINYQLSMKISTLFISNDLKQANE